MTVLATLDPSTLSAFAYVAGAATVVGVIGWVLAMLRKGQGHDVDPLIWGGNFGYFAAHIACWVIGGIWLARWLR